jgi:hypothetical protein
MRKISIVILSILVSLSFTSCDEVKDALDVKFDTEVIGTLKVVAVNTDENTYSLVLDATSDPEIQKYADNIKGVQVTKLMIGVENYEYKDDDAEIYFNGELGFGSETSASPDESCTLDNIPITNYNNTGNFEVNDCNKLLSNIASKLTADNAAKVFLIGSVTQAPMSFDLRIVATVKVTANPL